MSNDDDDWLSVQAAAAELNRSDRQLRSYAAQGRLRTRRRGPAGRTEYLRADVLTLAAELRPHDSPPRLDVAEIVPAVTLARRVEELTAALLDAQARAERAEQLVRLLPAPDEARRLQAEAVRAEVEAEALRAQLAELRAAQRIAWRIVAALALLVGLALALAALALVL